jgi:hypothetical protein
MSVIALEWNIVYNLPHDCNSYRIVWSIVIKLLSQLTILVFFVLCVSIGGYFIYNETGFLFGLSLSIFLIIFFSIYGDTFVLTILRARKLKTDERWKREIDAISFKIGLEKLSVYSTSTSDQPLYLLESLWGGQSITINPELLKKFSEEEVRPILTKALIELKKGRLWLIVVISLIFNLIEYPIFFMLKFRFLKYISFIFYYLFSPLLLIKLFSLHSRYDEALEGMIKEDNKYMLSGLFKLPSDVSTRSRVCNDLSFFRTDLNSLSSTILYDYKYLRQLSLKERFGSK